MRGRRMRVVGLLALAAVNASVLGTDVYLLSQRNVTTRVTLDTALRQYRKSSARAMARAGAEAAPTTLRNVVPAPHSTSGLADAARGTTAGGGGQAPLPSPPGAGATVAGAAVVPSGAPAGPAPVSTPGPFVPPPSGVYAYRTTGGEQVNILNASHSYPSVTYAQVDRAAGCDWTFQLDVIKEHTDHRTTCSEPGQVLEVDQSREITFFGETDGMSYTCTPPALMADANPVPGQRFNGVCGDTSGDAARVQTTFVGVVPLTIGGTTVSALHEVVLGTLTGRARGTSRDELWLSMATGMILGWHRSVDTVADAAFGAQAHYTESATFDLVSLVPAT